MSEWLQERGNPWGDFICLQLNYAWGMDELMRESEKDRSYTYSLAELADRDIAHRRRAEELQELYDKSLAIKEEHWVEWVLGPGVDPPVAHRLADADEGVEAHDSVRGYGALRQRALYPSGAAVKAAVRFSRGMIGSVMCRFCDWWGTTCATCEGGGHLMGGQPSERFPRGHYIQMCGRCFGVGRSNALGPILARHPVSAVRLTDFVFARDGNRIGIRTGGRARSDGVVPGQVFHAAKKYKNGVRESTEGLATWRDETVARDALTFGLLAWAREKSTLGQFARQNERPPAMGRPTEPGSAVTTPAEPPAPTG